MTNQKIPGGPEALIDRALVASFLANVPDSVYFKDRDSRFIALSQSLVAKHGGRTTQEVVGKTDFDFFSESHARPAFEDEQAIIRTGQPLLGKLEKETWPDGHVSWVLTSKMPLRNEHGEIIGTFGISKDVTEAKEMEFALEKSRRELMEASRFAGMAEVATGVLHNVGNVLTSVNVSTETIAAGLRQSKAESLAKAAALLQSHTEDLATYLTADSKGRQLPGFIVSLAQHFIDERTRLLREVAALQKSVDHIKEIVTMQQSYAAMAGVVEPLDAAELIEDALRMNSAALVRHDVRVVRDFQPVPAILGERGKLLQILVNLIRNAKYAADAGHQPEKIITLRIAAGAVGQVALSVTDNGVGIAAEHLTRIFQHGFTTKPDGHGFGLHSSANAAREMKGSLTAESAGLTHGATFTVVLPIANVALPPSPQTVSR